MWAPSTTTFPENQSNRGDSRFKQYREGVKNIKDMKSTNNPGTGIQNSGPKIIDMSTKLKIGLHKII